MAGNTKNKISTLAKDFGVKGKDFLKICAKAGIEGKSTTSAVEDVEVSILFDYISKENEVKDIYSYLYSQTTQQTDTKKESANEKTDKNTEEAPKSNTEKSTTRSKVDEKVSSEKKPAEAKTVVKKAEEKSDKAQNPIGQKTTEDNQVATKQPVPGTNQTRFQDRPAQGQQRNNFRNNENFNRNTNAFGTQFRPNFNNAQGQGTQGQSRGQSPAGNYYDRRQSAPQGNSRPLNKDATSPLKTYGTYGDMKFTKDGFVSTSPAKPSNQQKYNKPTRPNNNRFGNNAEKDDDESQSVRQPSLKPVYDKDGRARSRYASDKKAISDVPSPEIVKDDGSVRLLDIRGTDVDLSKYDEKLDKFSQDDDIKQRGDVRGKKNPLKGTGGRINRNESAARDISSGGFSGKGKKGKQRFAQKAVEEPVKKFTGPVIIPDEIMISDLAAKLRITTGEVVKKLIMMGLGMDAVGANKYVDFDTAYLLADELGIVAEKEVVVSIEEKLFSEDDAEEEENLLPRSPVVVVMGHVDHGKTSLLDAIRNAHVTAGEAGGITQHIGAYRVRINDRDITFLDTPGHEAFTAMRARGAQATDIAILVVAADDGIMPQTIEAINHAKAAGVSIIVAINKMDKPDANPDVIKQDLTKYDLVPEEWGGDTICVPVSALKKQGINELLEMVLLVADMKELKANPNKHAKGVVIEAKLDKGRGPVATVLVQSGTLHSGDTVIAGTAIGKVRTMTNDKGEKLKEAGPSVPVEITGLSEVPEAGNEFRGVEDEKMAKALVDKRKMQEKEDAFKANSKVSLDALFDQIGDGVKELAIIVKADVQGSAEAVKASLEKLSTEEVKVRVIHSGVGGIKESDVMLADASNAIIVGFNVRPDKGAMDSAERQNVDIRTYRIIYECIEEITAALNGMLAPEFKEVVIGHAQVRQTIHVPGVGFIAGSYVQDGKITRASQIRVVRDGIVIFEDKIASLRRFKDDVKEVAQGYECGVGLEKFNDIKENDILEAFVMEEIKREIKPV